MKAENRIRKIEEATGINEPCEVCEASNEFARRVQEFLEAHNIKRLETQPSDILTIACAWCLRPVRVSLIGFTLSERVLYERMDAVYEAGTLCEPGNATLHSELDAAFKRLSQEWYGEHAGEYEQLVEECSQKIDEIAARKAPRKIYLCRVPGCECQYPKTEEEWHRNVQRRLAA